jgi:hypothetical protein
MNPIKLAMVLVVLAAILPLSGRAFSRQAGNVMVDGHVQDSKGKPISGVKVALWVIGQPKPIDSTRTDGDGYFKFNAMLGATYDIVYTHSKLDGSCVPWLAESKNQHINKVLYQKGEKRPAGAFHESLAAVERMLLIVASLDKTKRGEAIAEFAGEERLVMGKEMPVQADVLTQDSRRLLEAYHGFVGSEFRTFILKPQ